MSKCSCIKDKQFLFDLSYEKDSLVFKDLSNWVTAESCDPIDTFDLQIINDGLSTTVKVPLNGRALIPYNTLPCPDNCAYDGIYTFKIDICDQILYRYEAILKNTNCGYSKLLLLENKTQTDWDNITRVFFEMEMIKNHTVTGNEKDANKQFQKLASFMEKLNCKCK